MNHSVKSTKIHSLPLIHRNDLVWHVHVQIPSRCLAIWQPIHKESGCAILISYLVKLADCGLDDIQLEEG